MVGCFKHWILECRRSTRSFLVNLQCLGCKVLNANSWPFDLVFQLRLTVFFQSSDRHICVCVDLCGMWPWAEEVLRVIRDVVTVVTTAGLMKCSRWPSTVPAKRVWCPQCFAPEHGGHHQGGLSLWYRPLCLPTYQSLETKGYMLSTFLT